MEGSRKATQLALLLLRLLLTRQAPSHKCCWLTAGSGCCAPVPAPAAKTKDRLLKRCT